jgi:hypothetical protein
VTGVRVRRLTVFVETPEMSVSECDSDPVLSKELFVLSLVTNFNTTPSNDVE